MSQGILISHLIQRGFSEPGSMCTLPWVPGESMTAFGLDRDGQDGIKGVLSCLAAVEWWVEYRPGCATAKICPPLGCFPKQHLISLWLIAFNCIYYYNFYSESRVWAVATEVLPWLTEMVKQKVQKQTQSRVASTSVLPNPIEKGTGFSFSRIAGSEPPLSPSQNKLSAYKNEELRALFLLLILFILIISPSGATYFELIRCAALPSAPWWDTCLFCPRWQRPNQKEWEKLSFPCRKPKRDSWLGMTCWLEQQRQQLGLSEEQ